MVVKIHKASASMEGPMRYNCDKVREGRAEIVCLNGLEGGTYAAFMSQFKARERLCRHDPGTVSFHMSVNPGAEDGISPEKIPEFVRDVLKPLGYADQPWILFRHDDIEREHYHVVSTRIRPDGRVVDRYHERYNCRDTILALESKYGYKVGNAGKEKSAGNAVRYYREGCADTVAAVEEIVRDAFSYRFTTGRQFADILRCRGIAVRQDAGLLSFFGTDGNGETCTPPISESRLELDVSEALESRLAHCRSAASLQGLRKARKDILDMVNEALDGSRDYREFNERTARLGIDIVLTRGRDGLARGANVIDHVDMVAMKGSDLSRGTGSAVLSLANAWQRAGDQSHDATARRSGATAALTAVMDGTCERKGKAKKKTSGEEAIILRSLKSDGKETRRDCKIVAVS